MTKEELLKNINLGVREIEAFGGTVKIRNLTIKEMLDFASADLDENTQMMQMASLSLVEPKMTAKELSSLDGYGLPEIIKVVKAITPDKA